MGAHCRRCRGEEGVFLVLWALLLVAIFTMAAIVIDLGALRADRRKERAAADAAAAAGANAIPDGGAAACSLALKYAVRNLGFDDAPYSCAVNTCNPLAPSPNPPVIRNVGGYQIRIEHPVLNTSPLMNAEAVGGDITQPANTTDGGECDRIGVEISHTRDSIFGRVVGNNQNSTKVHSVARKIVSSGTGKNIASLIVLEPSDCGVIKTGGSSFVEAKGSSVTHPGIIRTDTSATSCSPAMDAEGSSRIRACAFGEADGSCKGKIGHFAPTARAYTSTSPNFDGTLTKEPAPLTRAPIDSEYHCENAPTGCPVVSGVQRTDHIKALVTAYGGAGVPFGFLTIPDTACSPSSDTTFLSGVNYFVNCDTYIVDGVTVTFQGGILGGNIIFKGGIRIDTTGKLNVNTFGALAGAASTVYLRSGNITTQSIDAEIVMPQTFVYSNGATDFSSGSQVTWTAPQAGNFKDLLYWSESLDAHTFGTTLSSDGIWFQGNALLELTGGGALSAVNVQFWTDKIATQGDTSVSLQANPNRSITTEGSASRLIR